MTDQTRRFRLLQLLHTRPEISMVELVRALGAPPMVIRRDLLHVTTRI